VNEIIILHNKGQKGNSISVTSALIFVHVKNSIWSFRNLTLQHFICRGGVEKHSVENRVATVPAVTCLYFYNASSLSSHSSRTR